MTFAGAAVVGLASQRGEGSFGAVVRHTWKPALVSIASLLAVAIALHIAFPSAHGLRDVLAQLAFNPS